MDKVTTADWTAETVPSWLGLIWQGIVRPAGIVRFGMIWVDEIIAGSAHVPVNASGIWGTAVSLWHVSGSVCQCPDE